MAMMIMRYCLSVILVLLYKHYAEAAITPSFSPDELAVCPGDQATFSCTVVDTVNSQSTVWMANATADECALVHVLAFHDDTCGPFSAALGAQDGDCFPSTLTVTATTDLDNTFVQCFGPSLATQVGNGTLQVVGPPSAPVLTLSEQDITSSGDTNTRNVKLHWAILDRYPEFISRYILTTDPSAQPCGGSCTLEPGSMEFMLGEYEFELTVGESYTFGIRADNCDNAQTGAMSDQLTINLKVPSVLVDCSSTPTYDQALGILKTIDIEWDIIPVPLEEIAPGIGGGVSEYGITFQPDVGDPVVDTIDSSDCTAGVCSLEFTSDMSVTSYTSVTVTGQNLVGSGPARVCISQPISMMNDLLQVTIIARVVNATVECRFQSGFIGSARCRIDYGSDSMNPAYSDESSESGSAGDTVTILLSQTLDPNTTYYYSVYTIGATATNVQSQGSFRSECNPADLGNTTMTLDPRCQEVGNSVTTPNGIVCYESTTADSEAIYMCNSGYQLDGGVSTRVCQQDGQWDLPVPTCTTIPPTPETESSSGGLEIWQIVVIAIAIVIAVLAVVFFTVIGIVFCLNAKAGVVFQQGTKVDISPESHIELRNVPEGKSFEQEDDILKHVRVDTSTPVEEANGSEYSPPYQTVLAARNPTFDLSAELNEKLNKKQVEIAQQELQQEDRQAVEPEDQLTTDLDDQDRPEKPEYQQEETTEPSKAQAEQEETTEPSKAQAEQEETTEPSKAQAEQEKTTEPSNAQEDPQKEESPRVIHESPKQNAHGEPPAVMKKPKPRTRNEKRVISMEIPIYAPVAPQKTRSSIGGKASRARHYCVAINDYTPTSPEEMPIVSGELIRVTSTVTIKRWQGTTGDKKGFFPTAHVLGVNDGDIVMRAKYEFVPQDYEEIALNEGQIVVMTNQLGDGWLSGKSLSGTGNYLDGRFPESYMEKIHSIQL